MKFHVDLNTQILYNFTAKTRAPRSKGARASDLHSTIIVLFFRRIHKGSCDGFLVYVEFVVDETPVSVEQGTDEEDAGAKGRLVGA